MRTFEIELSEQEAAVYAKAAAHSPHTTESFISEVLRMVITQSFLMKELPVKPFPYRE